METGTPTRIRAIWIIDESGGGDPGRSAEPIEHGGRHVDQPFRVIVARTLQRHLRGHHAVDGYTPREPVQSQRAARERERRRCQHDRQRQLANDECVA
jgi:hypothetical protein